MLVLRPAQHGSAPPVSYLLSQLPCIIHHGHTAPRALAQQWQVLFAVHEKKRLEVCIVWAIFYRNARRWNMYAWLEAGVGAPRLHA